MICLKDYKRQSERYEKGREYNIDPRVADENEKYFGEKLWDRGEAKKATAAKAPAKKASAKKGKK